MRKFAQLFLVAFLSTAASGVVAFGDRPVEQPVGIDGGSPGDPDCVFRAGSFNVHLSAYQKLGSASLEKHCQSLPDVGITHLVFDLHSPDKKIRELPLSFRVVAASAADLGADGPSNSPTEQIIQTVPAQVYKTGVVEIDTNLQKSGDYAVVIESAPGGPAAALRIPLQVHTAGLLSDYAVWFMLALAAVILVLVLYNLVRKGRLPAATETASIPRLS